MKLHEVLQSNLQTKSSRHRKIDNKCRIHKFRRFSGKCKTYRLDVYYCINCGYQTPVADIFGTETLCHGCNKPFRVKAGEFKLFPICDTCTDIKRRQKKGEKVEVVVKSDAQDISSDWIEGETKKEDVFEEMLGELGIK